MSFDSAFFGLIILMEIDQTEVLPSHYLDITTGIIYVIMPYYLVVYKRQPTTPSRIYRCDLRIKKRKYATAPT